MVENKPKFVRRESFKIKDDAPPSVFLEKSMSESNLLNLYKSNPDLSKNRPLSKSLFISRGIYKYKNPINEVFPAEIKNGLSSDVNLMQRSVSMEIINNTRQKLPICEEIDELDFSSALKTNLNSGVNNDNKSCVNSCANSHNNSHPNSHPCTAINEEGEILHSGVVSPMLVPPRSRCVFIGEFTRECVFNVLRISRKWDHALKYIIGFHSYFIKTCCQMLKSHINQFTSGGAFINGVFREYLDQIIKDARGQNYCVCADVSNAEELALIEPLLRGANSYIICGKLPMLSRLSPYIDYLFMSKSAGVSKQYEANLRKKSTCMVDTQNMLKYSMGYKLSVLNYYLDKLEENEFIVAANPFNSVVMNLWYLPCKNETFQVFKTHESNAFYYPIGCVMDYFNSCGISHKKALKSYYLKNYRAAKMQTVLRERGNKLSYFYKDYLPRDIFLLIFMLAF